MGDHPEAQDEVALASHQRLAAAYDAGFFDDLVTPYRGLTRDANLRADTSLEKLATLKPVFGLGLDDPGDDDGRQLHAAVRRRLHRPARGPPSGPPSATCPRSRRVVDAEAAAVDFVHGDDGLLMAPAFAVPRLLARNGLTLRRLRLLSRSTRRSPRPC